MCSESRAPEENQKKNDTCRRKKGDIPKEPNEKRKNGSVVPPSNIRHIISFVGKRENEPKKTQSKEGEQEEREHREDVLERIKKYSFFEMFKSSSG